MSLSPEPVVRAAGRGRVLALTVDDGPATDTPALLDVLGRLGVRATFCVVGERVATPAGAALLRRTVGAGHALANHGWDDGDLGSADPATVERALRDTAAAVADAVGAVPVRWYRAANGSWGRTAEVAMRLGMQPLGVRGAVGDWLTQDEPTLVARLRAAVGPGALLLVHDGGGDRRGTVAAVDRVVAGLLGEGWAFTLPEHPEGLSGAAAG